MMHYLFNSGEIRNQLAKLFSENGKKWAVVGFVGYNALDHLPSHVSELSVVCWPKAGGTNPDGVRRLIDHGISVYFCDRLHQKSYWRQGAGLIVGSANLSENALGDAGLHEFGVYCDDKGFNIDQILKALNYAAVTPEALAKLDIEHAVQARKKDKSDDNDSRADLTFLEAIKTKHLKKWKLVTWSELRKSNDHIRAEVETHFNTSNWVNDNDVDSSSFQVGEFVLQVKTNDDGIVERANGRWLFVDHIVGKRGPRAVVQVNKLDNRTPPPFVIDSTFKKHLKEAFNTKSWEEIYDKNYVVLPEFVRAISGLYSNKG